MIAELNVLASTKAEFNAFLASLLALTVLEGWAGGAVSVRKDILERVFGDLFPVGQPDRHPFLALEEELPLAATLFCRLLGFFFRLFAHELGGFVRDFTDHALLEFLVRVVVVDALERTCHVERQFACVGEDGGAAARMP